ncbi:establishment of cohesion isoform X2 [Oratosquilla oratoria]|uniref:establishment of cohesion isoform X2 n=1 Tax=Oratosquilla oratoria TaxID=337810 RepID=UPI003F771A34
MSPMLPDCGILTAPRPRVSPPVKKFSISPRVSPRVAVEADTPSPKQTFGLATGFTSNFYKSSKSPVLKAYTPTPPVVEIRRSVKKDGINKGVVHKIKKPKLKAKDKKKNEVKAVVHRLREAKALPCLAADRSPLGTSTSGKKRLLATPGMSLLDAPDDGLEFLSILNEGKKFFTSRSKAAATVQIGKTIKLSASYGDISLKQREGGFSKKNIGKVIEEELDTLLATESALSEGLAGASDLPSVQANPRPCPTRVPDTPSPVKPMLAFKPRHKSPSPKKTKVTLEVSKKRNALELEDLEKIMEQWDDDETVKKRSSPRKSGQTASPRRSPRKKTNLEKEKLGEIPTSVPRRSPRKILQVASVDETSDTNKYFPIFDPKTRLTNRITNSDDNKRMSRNVRGSFLKKTDLTQTIIDAGQKHFGAHVCETCGMVYEIGDPSEEAEHKEFHDGFLHSLRYTGWRAERQVSHIDANGGRVIMVKPDDPVYCWRKCEEVVDIIDNELGFSEPGLMIRERSNVLLYILEKKIVGCLVAEFINSAQRVIPDQRNSSGIRLYCCSDEKEKVYVGISRIWVLPSARGKRVATGLVDAMRSNVYHGDILSCDKFAFSDPTESGMAFAEKYTKRRDFLVYRR